MEKIFKGRAIINSLCIVTVLEANLLIVQVKDLFNVKAYLQIMEHKIRKRKKP